MEFADEELAWTGNTFLNNPLQNLDISQHPRRSRET
jgi:hypothetical protein